MFGNVARMCQLVRLLKINFKNLSYLFLVINVCQGGNDYAPAAEVAVVAVVGKIKVAEAPTNRYD